MDDGDDDEGFFNFGLTSELLVRKLKKKSWKEIMITKKDQIFEKRGL